jgi:hypothetical protein
MELGTKCNPCKNVKDIKKAMKTAESRIYVDGIINLPRDILRELSEKEIKLWVVSKNDTM